MHVSGWLWLRWGGWFGGSQEAAGGERILKLNCGESAGPCALFQEHIFLKTQSVPDWMG